MNVKARRIQKTFVVTVGAIFGGAGLLAAASSATLENMQSAYDGESNAHARNLAFASASKCGKQGYETVS